MRAVAILIPSASFRYKRKAKKKFFKIALGTRLSSGKSENLHFDVVLLLSIAYKVTVKKTEELSLMILKKNPNFQEKLTFCLRSEESGEP